MHNYENNIKVFHIDDEYFSICKRGDRYTGNEQYWGHWVTNKATRTPEKYATYYRADGTVAHTLSERDAKRLWNACRKQNIDHVYPISNKELVDIIRRLKGATTDQITYLLGNLSDDKFPELGRLNVRNLPDACAAATEVACTLVALKKFMNGDRFVVDGMRIERRSDNVYIITMD